MAKIDLIQQIGDAELYTLHSHTQFCDGRAPMREFAQAASDRGFALYGFTPHSPVPIESSCNMAQADVPAYLAEVRQIQQDFPNVCFLAGMEIDYLGPDWGPAIPYFQGLDLDFSIGSVHFIPTQDGEFVDIDGRFENFRQKMAKYFHSDIRYVVETFYSQSHAMILQGHFDIIGHFDKIKHNAGLYQPGLEDTSWYKQLVDDMIDHVLASGVIVEINTKAWDQHQQLFPDQRHWRRLLQAGAKIVVNSDAHYPRLLNAGRQAALCALHYLSLKIHNQ